MSIFRDSQKTPVTISAATTTLPVPLRALSLPAPPSREPPCPGFYQAAGSYDRLDLLIDDKLARDIDVHLAVHILPQLRGDNERFLFVIGIAGDGKTVGVRAHTSRRRVALLLMTGADLSGATEGAPIEKLNQAQTWMRWKSAETGEPFAFLIDDIDASIVSENADQERTSNTNLLIGKLQAIASSPDTFTTADATPIPFLWTGNSSVNFRAPLIRAGRTRFHHYQLSWQQKAAMLTHLLKPETECARRRLRALVWKHRTQPLAFFTSLYADTRRAAVAAAIDRHGGFNDQPAIAAAFASAGPLDMRALYRLAQERRQAVGGDFTIERS